MTLSKPAKESVDELSQTKVSNDDLKRWDREHAWHPFTPMSEYLENDPITIVRGEGVRLQDIEGRWYLDGSSSIWLNLHGHHHPHIDEAIVSQLSKVAHTTMLGLNNVPATILARRLVELAPDGLTRVQFSDCGASAVEIAVKLAIQFWFNQGQPSKHRILGFHNNYHGDTFGAMGIAPSELFHRPFLSLLPDHPQLPYPISSSEPWVATGSTGSSDFIQHVDRYLSDHAESVAAAIIEPVEGAGGILPAPAGFLHQLANCCRQHNVLFIVDEVATGFGRTGHLFACTPENVSPDILCLGKALTGGYLPVAATLSSERIYEAFLGPPEGRRTFYHGHSYAGNPLGCAAAIASIELLPQLLPTLKEKVDYLSDHISQLHELSIVGETRQRGLMCGLSIEPKNESEKVDSDRPWQLRRLALRIARECRKNGLLLRPIGNVLILMPPPSSSISELNEMCEALRTSMDTISNQVESEETRA